MVLRGRQIPYDLLTSDLFSDGAAQKVVPFLGAGASISARTDPESSGPVHPQDPRIAKAIGCLKELGDAAGNVPVTLDATTLLYAETALEMAFVIQQLRNRPDTMSNPDIRQRLIDATYPPSAGELVDLLLQKAPFDSFDDILSRIAAKLGRSVDDSTRAAMLALLNLIAGVAGVSVGPLSSISAYFEIVSRRNSLLDHLSKILSNKTCPTPTHRLVATAASWHLKPRQRRNGTPLPDGAGDYLIMTTNYDCLMEAALDVPYVVLSMSLTDFLVRPRFGNMPSPLQKAFEKANPARPPNAFTLARPTLVDAEKDVAEAASQLRMTIVYKVHGCIQEWNAQFDTIVISDNNYVSNISRFSHNDGVIPVCVSDILKGRQEPYFLFLGYSLSDWNIRGMLRAIRAKRAGEGKDGDEKDYGDYTVVRKFNALDETFFTQNKIRIIHEDLKNFTPALEDYKIRYGV